MPILFGALAALGAFLFAKHAGAQSQTIVLLRAASPFGGPILPGSVASLLGDRTGTGLPPFAFKVRVVALPSALGGAFTGLFLTDTLGAKAGEFLEFDLDKIQNVES